MSTPFYCAPFKYDFKISQNYSSTIDPDKSSLSSPNIAVKLPLFHQIPSHSLCHCYSKINPRLDHSGYPYAGRGRLLDAIRCPWRKTAHARTIFWKLRCRKSARHCGAKHMSRSKCTKHTRSGSLLKVEMPKKCTPLWHEAHLQVKKLKTPHVRTAFGSYNVEKVHAVVTRNTFRSQNAQNTPGPDHFWKLRCRKSARRCGAKHMWK